MSHPSRSENAPQLAVGWWRAGLLKNRKAYNKQVVYYIMLDTITFKVFDAIQKSPAGVITLDILESLALCNRDVLKTILSRLNKAGKIIRLKRGAYATYPLVDAFVAAQWVFSGYLGLSTALYLHGFISEMPFKITVVTNAVSSSKVVGAYDFSAVALKDKAIGFERKGSFIVSTRAKTLFDCIYLPRYGVGEEKLVEAYRKKRLADKEWREFDSYVKKFARGKASKRFQELKKRIGG